MKTKILKVLVIFALLNSFVFADSEVYISPNNDGVKDTLKFNLSLKDKGYISEWVVNIQNSSGKIVKKISNKVDPTLLSANASFKENLMSMLKAIKTPKSSVIIPNEIIWNGLMDNGETAPDGKYTCYVVSKDDKGNSKESPHFDVIIDCTPPSVNVVQPSSTDKAFGGGAKRTLNIRESGSSEDLWTASIANAAGKTVRTYKAENTSPKDIVWDGKGDNGEFVEDGVYSYSIESTDRAGNKSAPARITSIMYTSEKVDMRAWLAAEHETIAPNGNKTKSQTFTLSASVTKDIDTWTFSIVNTENKKVVYTKNESGALQPSINWDGKNSNGTFVDGVFSGTLTINYLNGTKVSTESPAFLCSSGSPKISAKIKPDFFSPDNDGKDDECIINLSVLSPSLPLESWKFEVFETQDPSAVQKERSNIPFWTISGKSQVTSEPILWDGKSNKQELVQSAMDYPFKFSVTDVEGQKAEVEGTIYVDVLVIVEDGRLKMQVPTIIFRADHADFVSKKDDPSQGLEQSIIDNNMRWLKRIATVLNKFKEYKVAIEGHANSITKTEAEENQNGSWGLAAKPLSKSRADFVKTQLVKFGVKEDRLLETKGMGGSKLVADNKDPNTRWKNRRVEFILDRGQTGN